MLNIFLGLSIVVLPIINVYYLAKLCTILDKFDTDN